MVSLCSVWPYTHRSTIQACPVNPVFGAQFFLGTRTPHASAAGGYGTTSRAPRPSHWHSDSCTFGARSLTSLRNKAESPVDRNRITITLFA